MTQSSAVRLWKLRTKIYTKQIEKIAKAGVEINGVENRQTIQKI